MGRVLQVHKFSETMISVETNTVTSMRQRFYILVVLLSYGAPNLPEIPHDLNAFLVLMPESLSASHWRQVKCLSNKKPQTCKLPVSCSSATKHPTTLCNLWIAVL